MAFSFTENGKAQDWINLVLAIFLFLSPWLVGFAAEVNPAWNAWLMGAAMGIISLAALYAFAEWEEWVNGALGLWLIVAPWILGFTASMNAMWTHVAIGALVVLVSAWGVWTARHEPHAHA
ncbi:MAG: SPW repeat protein [Rhizobiaceae bacterium]